MLKIIVIAIVSFHLVLTDPQFRPEPRALAFTYNEGSVAAYPVGTTIIYRAGTTVDYIAGATVIYLYQTTINFPEDTEVYWFTGPVTYPAGTDYTFFSGTQVAYGPGSSVTYKTPGETRYAEFNGNSHAIAGYPKQTSVQYYYGPRGSNLILFPPGANPLAFYNPGGSTQFGQSALAVEKDPEEMPTTRTYGMRGGGYSYCRGYSNQGWPRTTYYNRNTGYRSNCNQNGPNNYSYNNNGGYNNGGNRNSTSGGGGGGGYNGGYGK